MRYLRRIGWGLCWALLAGTIVFAQMPANPAIREIDDPHSGMRWVLVKDSEHPGGPGRLVQVNAEGPAGFALNVPGPKVAAPVIRAGDRIVVEEHTDVADAVLEAVALAPAVELGQLRARLTIGCRVVRVIAIAPGRARLSAAGEERP
jgi:hypothetical protein